LPFPLDDDFDLVVFDEILRTLLPLDFVVPRADLGFVALDLPALFFAVPRRVRCEAVVVRLELADFLPLDVARVPFVALEALDFAAPVLLAVDAPRDRPAEVPRARPRPEDLVFCSAACAVSRLTSLLKLLRSPEAVSSCTSNASPRSSNFSKKSSHSMCSSESTPLYPGKSIRNIPGSSSLSVRFTAAGEAPRSSTQLRISS